FDLYAADVGEAFALLIVFEGQRGAGQAGLVLRYGRQAADDLLTVLNVPGALAPSAPVPPAVQAPPAAKAKTGSLKKKKTGPLSAAAKAEPAQKESTAPAPAAAPAPVEKKVTSPEAAAFWANVDGAEIGDARTGTLSWEEAAKLGLVPPKTPTDQ